ncbi:MAG: DUF2207 domain-containing protein [Candidatus Heimdallarchaeota archaeon]|nr:DUF2207 domain-containing protein [Candidatus Heimdallarchaeota archaeon]
MGRNNSWITRFLSLELMLLFLTIISFTLIQADVLALNSPPQASGGLNVAGYDYSHWNETITVNMDGSLTIVEEMTFRVDPGSYGFAYRNLKWRQFADVESWSIEAGAGAPTIHSYYVEKSADIISFNWEWARRSYNTQTELPFILTYTVTSAMDLRGGRDRVYWNVIGDEFEVPIYDISTYLILPKQFNHSEVRHTTYYAGSDPGDDEGVVYDLGNKTVVEFYQSSTAPGQAYTIDVDTPASGINMPFSWRVYLNSNWIIPVAMGLVPFLLFFLIAFLIAGKDPKAKGIPALNEVRINKCQQCGYRDTRNVKYCSLCGAELVTLNEVGPPNDLTPAEVGTLLDEKFNKIDFVAEFFYLAEKGYFRIIQLPDSQEIYFERTTKNPAYGSLSNFDKGLVNFVERNSRDVLWFTNPDKEIKDEAVDVTSLTTIKNEVVDLWKMKKFVYSKLSGGDNSYFTKNPEKIRSKYARYAMIGGIGGSVVFWLLAEALYVHNLKLSLIGVISACLLGFILSNYMPKLTPEGAKMKASWERYLQIIRGEMVGFPDPYEQFNFSMDHFSYLLVDPDFDLPAHLRRLSKNISTNRPPRNYRYISPYWYFYPGIYYPPATRGGIRQPTIGGIDRIGQGIGSVADGISSIAESLPTAISNMAEGLTSAISDMNNSLTPPSSSGGSGGFGGGSSGGGGGGGGGGIG